ncbi:6-phosphofructokinase, partial [Lancefieldella rimae]|uniref:6-phosphofructokinase n=1 Tax=Lancefieldella rimae TaxID=1383 RepID=UPI003C6F8622
MRKIKTILVGQSGGPTAAINASLAGVIRTAYSHNLRILGMRNGIEGFLEGHVVDLAQALNLASSSNTAEQNLRLLRKTPSSWLGSCRFKLPEPDENPSFYQRVISRINELGIDAILYIGGNDSMDTTNKLSRYFTNTGIDVPVVGVPKTIDNDLEGTDHTPGF